MFAEPLELSGESLPGWYDQLQPFFCNMLNPYLFWPCLGAAVFLGILLYRRFKKPAEKEGPIKMKRTLQN